MIIDAHLHCTGQENSDEILQALDAAGVDVAVLLAPFLTEPYSLDNRESLRAANEYLGALITGHEDRLVGFAVVNPLHDEAGDDLEEAVLQWNLSGLKLVPTGWYPYDDRAHRLYERAALLNVPILFHSGIFIDGRSGRYCRPSYYEAIREHPSLRVTLAHLGWPWTDEANAVGLIDLLHGVAPEQAQFRFDISFGPPPVYRHDALRKALDVLGPELLQFGSDRFLPCSGEHVREMVDEVQRLLDSLAVPKNSQERILGGTAAAWLGLTEPVQGG